MIYLYNIILAFLSIFFLLPFGIYRLITGKDKISSYRQKLGRYDFPPPPSGGIWIHAVSVGETNTAVPLVENLRERFKDIPIVLSTTTATGMGLARKRLGEIATLFYFPIDLPFAVRRAISFVSPSVIIIMETEIWPNFIYIARKKGIPVIIANGRISGRSFGRYKIVKRLFAPFIKSISSLMMQSEGDAKKIIELGANRESVKVSGNLKFDRPLPEHEDKNSVRDRFNIPLNRPVVIFASTHPGEDEYFFKVINGLSAEFKDLFTVIVPRHIERAQKLALGARSHGYKPALRSDGNATAESMLILDTIGELAHSYGAADLAVIGGSFVPHGGQNPLEALEWKVPVIFGPYMENFPDISLKLIESGAAVKAESPAGLSAAIRHWLKDDASRQKAGTAGYETILKNRGALKKTIEGIEGFLKNTV